ncbi:uncharacterized protein LOC114254771 [Monomorium pharaonis]|uniref:uncharacterized protein LOC114254771 n=1 Tax=Monomorium pharaonis TaxID=307658 RepID=UPI00102E200B|nr:uncharacterized protein LOC114254771 [Monomorium pharaonis]
MIILVSYDDARKRLVDAEFTSTLKTDAEHIHNQRPKRKSRKNKIISDSSKSDNNEETAHDKIPELSMLRTLTKNNNTLLKRPIITPSKPSTSTIVSASKSIITPSKPSTSITIGASKCTSAAINSQKFSEKPVNSSQNIVKTTMITSEFDESNFSCLVLTKLVSIEKSMNLLLPMLKQLFAHFKLSNISHVKNVPEMPVDTDEKLKNIEQFLKIRQNFEYLVNVLNISGGTTIAQITKRTLEKIITDNYGKNFNWAGRAPKKAFKVLKIKDLTIAIVKSVEPNAAVNKIEDSIKDWLKMSSVRIALADTRTLKKNLSATTND